MGVETKLTRRASDVAELIALGFSNRDIAGRLFLSERTVEWHVEQIMNKLGFNSRTQIAAWIGRSQMDAAVPVPTPPSRGNLPAQFTSFVGREHELRTLLDLVTTHRLVTLTGPGGTGKTRLALRLAEELRPEFRHGVWFCDLALVSVPDLVGDAVAQALLVKRRGATRLEAVRENLRDKSALLLLDNCEHLQSAAAAATRDLLNACPSIRILATSRAPLGVIGEAISRIDPMPESDAVQLFAERAAAAAPSVRILPDDADTIAAICRQLDRVPLAIELTVPRLRVQTLRELASGVHNPAWQPASRDRHGSVQAMIEWSYRLLEPDEQSLFRCLGAFSGWFDAADAAAVAKQADISLEPMLGSLAEHSLVVHHLTGSAARFRLLEILKAFAITKLEDARELEHVRLKHAEHMVSLARGARVANRRGDPSQKMKVSAMVDDVRASFPVLIASRPRQAALLSAAMMQSWVDDGRVAEGVAWSELTLAANSKPSRERCENLLNHSYALGMIGRTAEARTSLSEGEAFADAAGNEDLRQRNLVNLATAHGVLGDHAAALRLSEEAADVAELLGPDYPLAVALNSCAISHLHMGQPHDAAVLFRRALAMQDGPGTPRLALSGNLARAQVMLGQIDDARQLWLEVAQRAAVAGWTAILTECLLGLALVAGLEGDRETAIGLHLSMERQLAETHEVYDDPTDPVAERERDLLSRLMKEVGPEIVARLRAETATLEPEALLGRVQVAR
jgi:predicted ATPase/DNA-binding CsgD family transcriptional regulator